MSALPQFAGARDDIALVLLGNGVVGGALLQLLATPAAAGVRLVGVANSMRQLIDVRGIVFTAEFHAVGQRGGRSALAHLREDESLCHACGAARKSAPAGPLHMTCPLLSR